MQTGLRWGEFARLRRAAIARNRGHTPGFSEPTPQAKKAFKRLRSLLGPGAQLACYKLDKYQRAVCRVRSTAGQDVATEMISAGLAWYTIDWAHEDEPAERERYQQLEAKARAARVGLWSAAQPMPPWVCRSLPEWQCR